ISVQGDSGQLKGATVRITGFASGEVLGFTAPAGSGITGGYASGVLTLSGTASATLYEQALESVTYTTQALGPHTITYTITDGLLSASTSSAVGVGTMALGALDGANGLSI